MPSVRCVYLRYKDGMDGESRDLHIWISTRGGESCGSGTWPSRFAKPRAARLPRQPCVRPVLSQPGASTAIGGSWSSLLGQATWRRLRWRGGTCTCRKSRLDGTHHTHIHSPIPTTWLCSPASPLHCSPCSSCTTASVPSWAIADCANSQALPSPASLASGCSGKNVEAASHRPKSPLSPNMVMRRPCLMIAMMMSRR